MPTIQGVVIRVHADSVVEIKRPTTKDPTPRLIGDFSGRVRKGDYLVVSGEWEMNRRYMRQLVVDAWAVNPPPTEQSVAEVLAYSGHYPQVDVGAARKIVARHGVDAPQVLAAQPDLVLEFGFIRDVAKRKELYELWKVAGPAVEAKAQLRRMGLDEDLLLDAYECWGRNAPNLVGKDPYVLRAVGANWDTMDRLRKSLHLSHRGAVRQSGALVEILERMLLEGHTAPLESRVVVLAGELTGLSECDFCEGIDRALRVGSVARIEDRLQLGRVADWERELGQRIREMSLEPIEGRWTEGELSDRVLAADLGFVPSLAQARAAEVLCRAKIGVLIGPAGSGKSAVMRMVVSFAQEMGLNVALLAPTGKAALRLREATGRAARTIHSALRCDENGKWGLGPENPLDADLVVVDEASMVATETLWALVRSLRPEARLALVGDDSQLPSVGGGQVLADLVEGLPNRVWRLRKVYRQAEGSKILDLAEALRRNVPPRIDLPSFSPDRDVSFVHAEHESDVRAALLRLLKLHPDAQVLSPRASGPLGAPELALWIREQVHGRVGELQAGDLVVQTQNRHEKKDRDGEHTGLLNGDSGVVVAVTRHKVQSFAVVQINGREYGYQQSRWSDIAYGYALGVHRAQGSQWPVVVLVVHPSATSHLLHRKMLYTAATRAAKRLIVVGTMKAFHQAVRERGVERATLLGKWLAGD